MPEPSARARHCLAQRLQAQWVSEDAWLTFLGSTQKPSQAIFAQLSLDYQPGCGSPGQILGIR